MSADRAGKCHCNATVIYLGKIMATTKDPWATIKSKLIKTGTNEEQGNYRPVSLHLNLWESEKAIIPKYISNHIKENNLIESSQYGFTKGISFLNSLVALCTEMIASAD